MSGFGPVNSLPVYRIATSAPDYGADDLSGAGAEATGGRWNPKGMPVVYTSTSRALACLETVVHVRTSKPLPLNRYLVEILIPGGLWSARMIYEIGDHSLEWDAEPPGQVSINWGRKWLEARTSLLAEVPSVIIPEESNVLLNPAHPDMSTVSVRVVRKSMYDGRLVSHDGR